MAGVSVEVIEWNKTECRFGTNNNERIQLYNNIYEVIGNMYENPELLEQKII